MDWCANVFRNIVIDKCINRSSTYLSTYCKVVLITSEVLGRVTDTLKPYQLFTCCHLEKCVYMIKFRASSTKTYFSVSLTIMFLHWLRSFGGFSSTLRTPFSSVSTAIHLAFQYDRNGRWIWDSI